MTKKYSMGFTSGSLFRRESVLLSQLYIQYGEWGKVRARVMQNNLLQARTQSTAARIYRDVSSRLRTLHKPEIRFLVQADPRDQGYLLWLALCRRYRFIADFAIEVLHEYPQTLATSIDHQDYEIFFNRKAEWHPELDALKQSTRSKLREVLFRAMRDADVLTADNQINAAMPSPQLQALIASQSPPDMLHLPLLEPRAAGATR